MGNKLIHISETLDKLFNEFGEIWDELKKGGESENQEEETN